MSTRVEVNSGICGFRTTIAASKGKGKRITIALDSNCEMVCEMQDDVEDLDMMVAFMRFVDNPVYKAASRHLEHVACPVPCGILKALEVESGLCLPKDVGIMFLTEE